MSFLKGKVLNSFLQRSLKKPSFSPDWGDFEVRSSRAIKWPLFLILELFECTFENNVLKIQQDILWKDSLFRGWARDQAKDIDTWKYVLHSETRRDR